MSDSSWLDTESWARTSSAHRKVIQGRKLLFSIFWNQTFGLLAASEERSPQLSSLGVRHRCKAEPPPLRLPVTKPVTERLTVVNISLLPTHWGCFKTFLFCPSDISPILSSLCLHSPKSCSGHIFCHLPHRKLRLFGFSHTLFFLTDLLIQCQLPLMALPLPPGSDFLG